MPNLIRSLFDPPLAWRHPAERLCFRAAILSVLALFPAGALCAQLLPLFVNSQTSAASPAGEVATGDQPLVELRSRSISLNQSAVAALRKLSRTAGPRAATGQGNILLNLFPDTALNLEVVEWPPDGGRVYIGSVLAAGNGEPDGDSVLTWYQGAMVGYVRLRSGEYYRITVEPFGGGEVRQLVFRGYPGGQPDYVETPRADENGVVRGPVRAPSLATEAAAKAAESWLPGGALASSGYSEIGVLVGFSTPAGTFAAMR
ncbi:MAG: hypothetical protein KIT83_01820 [Bryobacterales bacterium]|nr:hypothetical protein [Bryobacterales bacterium]